MKLFPSLRSAPVLGRLAPPLVLLCVLGACGGAPIEVARPRAVPLAEARPPSVAAIRYEGFMRCCTALTPTAAAKQTSAAGSDGEGAGDAAAELPPVGDGHPAAAALRTTLEELATYDPDARARLRRVAAVPAELPDAEARAYAMLDVLVRFGLPYVLEFVFPPYSQHIDEALRSPRALVELAPIRDRRSFERARPTLRRLATLAEAEAARREASLEEEREHPSPREEGEVIPREIALETDTSAAYAMGRFLRDELLDAVARGEALTPDRVVELREGLSLAARANDLEGADTLERSHGVILPLLRVLAGERFEALGLPELDVQREMRREREQASRRRR